jgi:hypothetical protein
MMRILSLQCKSGCLVLREIREEFSWIRIIAHIYINGRCGIMAALAVLDDNIVTAKYCRTAINIMIQVNA